jgi:hypothetical protein
MDDGGYRAGTRSGFIPLLIDILQYDFMMDKGVYL